MIRVISCPTHLGRVTHGVLCRDCIAETLDETFPAIDTGNGAPVRILVDIRGGKAVATGTVNGVTHTATAETPSGAYASVANKVLYSA